mmetsp:Transcript_25962/g.57325  ORF Transcript_25962/g.57325 Transcript_25962/m.57325 type:complete len:204 (+) Transcript_25962:394-1005(+)
MAPRPLGDSSSSSICVCMKADSLAFEAVSMEEASKRTVRAAVTRPIACLSSCINPFAISRFMMLRERSRVSMVSASSASRSVQSACCDLRTWDACSKSDSASAISLLRSSIVLSSTSISELAFSTVAFKSSLRPAELVSSCWRSLALSWHHSTNFSYCCCSTSPSLTIWFCSLPSNCSTFVTGLPAEAAAKGAMINMVLMTSG